MNTLQDHWQFYATKVLPPNAPAIQVKECQLAFYAGALAYQHIALIAADDNMSEDAGAMMMEGLATEIREFAKSVT